MNPMLNLVVATGAFLLSHYVSSTPLRSRIVAAIGEKPYLAAYSAVAAVTLAWMVWAYYRAPFIGLWYVPFQRYVPLAVMPFAFILLVAGLMTPNPTLVGRERALRERAPIRGIMRVTRHPVMWGIALWAGAHFIARGDAAGAIFFGSFLLLALTGTVLIDARKRSVLGEDWSRFAAVTSNVPFAAIAAGKNRFNAAEIGAVRVGAALIVYAAVLWLHPFLFGARPY